MLVLAADHIVRDAEGFRRACQEALKPAMGGYLVTFGVHPHAPATSYGYIRPGAKLAGSAAHVVEAFVEKPNEATASRYVAEGFLWNSGNFMFRADRMLDELHQFEPEMRAPPSIRWTKSRAISTSSTARRPFLRAPKKSIDYAVMERTAHAAVLPVDFGWSDIGSWGALWKELEHDQSGNTVDGPTALIDTKNSLVFSDENILTTVVGLTDVIVVATSDAVLVVSKNQSEKVKDLVTTLKKNGRREATEHKRIHRPWGYYQGVDAGARYQVKRIVVKPGGQLSLQKHHHRAEHWVVVKGTAQVVVNDDTRTVHENESIYVPIGSVHRLANPGKIPLELIEVQVGSYLGEDDIIRFDDIYKRTTDGK